jgi:hypothetical protein
MLLNYVNRYLFAPFFPFLALLRDLRDRWTVQRQQNHGFSSVACDMTIEQTLNRDSKTKGGKNKFIYSSPVVTVPTLKSTYS